jgi:hypothetical protein
MSGNILHSPTCLPSVPKDSFVSNVIGGLSLEGIISVLTKGYYIIVFYVTSCDKCV